MLPAPCVWVEIARIDVFQVLSHIGGEIGHSLATLTVQYSDSEKTFKAFTEHGLA